MNYPIDTIADTLAFAVRGGYDKRVYPANLGNGGGTSRRRRCAWCINCVGNLAATITLHYHKDGFNNFLGLGSSHMLSTAVLTVWEV